MRHQVPRRLRALRAEIAERAAVATAVLRQRTARLIAPGDGPARTIAEGLERPPDAATR